MNLVMYVERKVELRVYDDDQLMRVRVDTLYMRGRSPCQQMRYDMTMDNSTDIFKAISTHVVYDHLIYEDLFG